MELRQLRYFLVLSDILHFHKAADRLHINEQPLSRQIKSLEDEIGFKLFKRTTRRVELTPAGVSFRQSVIQAFEILHKGITEGQNIDRDFVGSVSIAYSSVGLHGTFPQAIKSFHNQFPRVKFNLIERYSPDLEHEVQKQQIDLGITDYTGAELKELPPALHSQIISSDQVVVAVKHGQFKTKRVKLIDLSNQNFVTYDHQKFKYAYQQFLKLCGHVGFQPRIVQETGTDLGVLSFVASGLGVSLVPQSYSDILNQKIDYLPLDPAITLNETAIWRHDNESKLIAQLLNSLKVD